MGLTKPQAQALGTEYRASRRIVAGQPETWCAAGRYEVANKTRIGKYLIDAGRFAN
jgi:hypothetical protein